MVKIYLDDDRPTPKGWFRARWPEDVISGLETGLVTEISLDHDLGDDEIGTGYDVLVWIEEKVVTEGFKPPKIHVHTGNPAARERMLQAVQSIEKFASQISIEVPASEMDQAYETLDRLLKKARVTSTPELDKQINQAWVKLGQLQSEESQRLLAAFDAASTFSNKRLAEVSRETLFEQFDHACQLLTDFKTWLGTLGPNGEYEIAGKLILDSASFEDQCQKIMTAISELAVVARKLELIT